MARDYERLLAEWSKACDISVAGNQKVADVLKKMSRATPPHVMEELSAALEKQKAARKKLDELAAELLPEGG
jgi:hypothetical protein